MLPPLQVTGACSANRRLKPARQHSPIPDYPLITLWSLLCKQASLFKTEPTSPRIPRSLLSGSPEKRTLGIYPRVSLCLCQVLFCTPKIMDPAIPLFAALSFLEGKTQTCVFYLSPICIHQRTRPSDTQAPVLRSTPLEDSEVDRKLPVLSNRDYSSCGQCSMLR